MRYVLIPIAAVWLAASTLCAQETQDNPQKPAALALFEKRILPILNAKKPSSCSECHLSGVDLKDYLDPSQEKTFTSLVKAGLIDVKKPAESKLLTFIARKPEKPSLVTDKIRAEELSAFRTWIEAAVADPALLAAPAPDKLLGPSVPVEVIRHARNDRVLASFLDNIWSEVGRCAACHSPDQNQKQVKEHGEQVSWIKLRDPQATLAYLLESGLIDPDKPTESLLLKKPLNTAKHVGGVKMVEGDRSYKQFRRFLDDYGASAAGQYKTARQLPVPPGEISQVSGIWLKVTGVPARFDKMLMQVDLYPQEADGSWSRTRWATSDRQVFGKGQLWQHSLTITAPRETPRAESLRKQPTLPPGKYLIKLYVDQKGKLGKDFTAELGQAEFVGQVQVDSRWPEGYGAMTAVKYPTP